MNLASRLVTLRTPALAASCSWWGLCQDARRRVRESEFPGGMSHACELETSAYMHLRPGATREELIEDCMSTTGRPSLATPEKGREFVDESVANLIEFCEFFRDYEPPPSGRSEKPDRPPGTH